MGTFTKLKTTTTAKFMGVEQEKEDLMSLKYCAVFLSTSTSSPFPSVLPGYTLDKLGTSSVTWCKNSRDEILATVNDPALQATINANTQVRPTKEMEDKGILYIDNFDPTPETLNDEEDDFKMLSNLLISLLFIFFLICLAGVGGCIFLAMKESKNKALELAHPGANGA